MFREYRNGADRRQRIIPPIKYLFFGGRRKHIRRKEDCDNFHFKYNGWTIDPTFNWHGSLRG